jgi:nicotinamidase-related amidase
MAYLTVKVASTASGAGSPVMTDQRRAVLALHWQVNVIKPEGFFGAMLSEPVARTGVVERAVRFHRAAAAAGLPLIFTRFTIPEGEGRLVRTQHRLHAGGEVQEAFRPDAPGAALIPELAGQSDLVVDNQKLSGLAGNGLPGELTARGIDTVFITGVATNLTVEQTARHGTDLGFTVHVISDCVAAVDETTHAASLANLELATAGCLAARDALA